MEIFGRFGFVCTYAQDVFTRLTRLLQISHFFLLPRYKDRGHKVATLVATPPIRGAFQDQLWRVLIGGTELLVAFLFVHNVPRLPIMEEAYSLRHEDPV